ncbi:Hybrid Polyketide synthase-nonribosomal peptide synthetase [Tolypocladium capitatum]|uniref:Hybrid Polyketide synthase-nonribosomal peptide synthetase n=1 Tax=Tolypocladium capitatum TaxID=45235 RepID=A0A2K3QLA6_9HYPO|nr:Hybrid Polyketide synthase-nonribosomal peptide synthetase [Tolypocladium capitatum]
MSEPVGIIGSACRFPGGADSPSKLWELLKNPRDVLSEFPLNRLNLWSFYHQNGEHHGSTDVQNKGYLLSEDVRVFDSSFFRISPSEADSMDPQQRILLETVYEALESAGCPLDQVQGSLTSVYAGLMNGDYADIQARDLETIPTHHGTGTHRSILSNRISYFLDLRGASMTIDTACSSSLVALHQAVQSLRLGESDMAIVAGANLLLDPTMYVAESKLHMLSPDSRSRMWDAASNGYARGEGFAAIVLKPLDKAISDGNQVECVVRGSAVNSDGRTAGITVPSATAQTTLIRQAYRDAGLDPPIDRCQFFEAHGTGTRAGDPVEARAIRDAFFPEGYGDSVLPGKLLVGSIKTVVGHLEGCAGLAGVLKASLAMQNRTIPPNMHFSELNPSILPLYDRLEIPTEASEWPEVPAGSPLRTSVNSFGFGGTNAHVILEAFEEEEEEPVKKQQDDENAGDERFVGPLLLSANSRDSLVRSVQAHADHIRNNKHVDLGDLSWTLQFRRTHFGNSRAFFSGATRHKLLSYMDAFVADSNSASTATTVTAGESHAHAPLADDGPAILGIFTGQGAQWPSMGRNLMMHSPLFRSSVALCEASLAALDGDAPPWSLAQELLAEGDISRVGEAAISQPLCTAVQVGLVDVLRASGVAFRSVVGHSSGEIAAVYAAGIISAHDAVRIAYYRGFHAWGLAKGPKGQRGAMLAAGLSFEGATALCARPEYAGRVNVAAANAPASVTLSGDVDAVCELKARLDAEKTFARRLEVDTAYHSHHMEPCSAAYLASLKACNIQVRRPNESCIWVSSVRGDVELLLDDEDDGSLDVLKDQYWVDNLLSPVLFAPAVECSLWRAGPFDIVTEIGPHPALKGPSTQIFKASLGSSLPYFSVMRRGDDEVEAFSGGLGYLWEHFGPAASIDFDGYRRAFVDQQNKARCPRFVKGLPSYCWDHSRVHWKESRISHNFRLGDRHVHEMLGRRATDDTPELLRWRNILRPAEIPWVRDHVIQGQIVLPGAAYVAAVTEAVKVLAGGKHIELVELVDLKIPRAVVLQENRSTELTTTLCLVRKSDSILSAEFAFSAASADDAAAVPERTCSGRVDVHVGEANPDQLLLPLPSGPPPNLNAVDVEALYTTLRKLGINYQGSFRATKSAQRTMGYASTQAFWDAADLGDSYSLHPAVLDVAFHAVFAAFTSPSTGQMWTMYLPVGIRRVSIQLGSLPRRGTSEISAHISARVTASSAKGLEGDLQIMCGSRVGVQVEGVELQATGDPVAGSDWVLFSNSRWLSDVSTGVDKVVLERQPDPAANEELFEAMGRTALYYYRTLLDDISPREVKGLAWHKQMFWQSAQHWVDEVRAARHPTARREWLEDSRQAVWKQAERCQDTIDILIMRALGENLSSIVRGETRPLEVMMDNDMLSRFYVEAYGLDGMNDHIARTLGQITHRHPRANILEIGAGVGGTTRIVLRAVGNSFGHYTFTDISSGFLEKGADKFSEYHRRMTFKVCDIEKDPIDQGFVEGAYDVVVAANVLHATRCLADTMRNVRRLLKPGGYLVMMEITGDLLRVGFIMGLLPGWWLGPRVGDEGRQWAPGISPVQWDHLLQRTGFSGVDQIVSDNAVPHKHDLFTLVSQAVDEKFDVLRSPLSHLSLVPALPHKLLILGGETLAVARLARNLKKMLAPWDTPVDTVSSLDLLSLGPDEKVSVISLTELDQPLFATEMTAAKLGKLQILLNASESVLWTTVGCRGSNPTSNIFVGIARALRTERSDINLQLLDFGKPSGASAVVLAEYFLRLALSKEQDYVDKHMLWTTEAELAFDGETLQIPRLVPDGPRNERYNASRRTINKEVTLASSEVEVDTYGGVVSLLGVDRALSRRLMTPITPEQIILDVHLSVALPHPDQQYFLCYGSIESKYGKAFAVSQANRSVILCSSHDALQLDSTPFGGEEAPGLEALAGQLIARNLASNIPRRGAILFYEPPSESFVKAIECSSLWKTRQVYYATSRTDTSVPACWVSINPHALSSSIRQKILGDITAVVDFSAPDARDLRAFVPFNCVIRRFEPSLVETDNQALASAYADALVALNHMNKVETRALPVRTLPGSPSSTIAYPAMVDWRQQHDEAVTVQVKPLTPAGIFSSSKTHLMVGLNGNLGQSICGYMVRNGARHIAISSRRGEVDPSWLVSMRRDHRADIRLYKMDVTSQQSIRSTLDQIKTEMPPIGGVANGAMVLNDKMFLNMDVDSLNNTLKPKVNGSRYLDELFPAPDLDYFILFSSVTTVGNNRGQGNYHAANLFMTSLASNRRARGLAASVIHMGGVLDAGYVARKDRKLTEHLRKQGFMPTSETDAHFLFAEGVLASPVNSQLDADICMGFEPFQDRSDAPLRPPWYGDWRLSHFIIQPKEDVNDSRQRVDDTMHIRQKLNESQTVQEAHSLLQEAFLAKLESMMQLNAGSVNSHVPLLDLGFDSLLAVETRTWFLKEVHVDVPVLRFLGGDTVHEICQDTVAQYLARRAEKDPEENKATTSAPHFDTSDKVVGWEDEPSQPTSSVATSESGQPSSSPTAWTSDAQNVPDFPSTSLTGISTPTNTPEIPKKTDLPDVKLDTYEKAPSGIRAQKRTVRDTSRVEAMSYAQSRLWFIGQYLEDPTACNIVMSYVIRGPLDVARLRGALDKVIGHHASLRTCFYADDETGDPTQGLLRTPFPSSSLKYLHASSREEVQREFDALRNHGWDLAYGDTFAATLLSTEYKDEHVIIFGYHHIVIDGVSWYVILRDLERAYTSQWLSIQGKQYMDASVEQRQAVEFGAMDKEISFWETVHATLPDVLPLLPMASARRRRPLRRYESHTVTRDIGSHLVAKIKDASKALRVTPFHFYLTAVQVLFSKLLDIHDLCIGVADASRTDDGLANTVGFFLNMLPLRFKLDRHGSFADLVRRTSRHALQGRINGRVPIDVILDHLNVPRDASFSPLFQVTFNYRVGAFAEVGLGDDCRMSIEAIRDAESPFDLGFGIYETADGSCDLQVVAQSYLYDRDAAGLTMGAYVNLLDVLSSDTSLMVGQYGMFDAAAVQNGISVGKGLRKTWDWPDTLSKRVGAVVKSHGDSVAIIEPRGAITYGELEGRIRLVAWVIQTEELAKGSHIGVLCQPSADSIVSMLAILRLGHVYVPIESNLPNERHAAILADCKPAMLLCHQETLELALSLTTDLSVVNLSTLSTGVPATDTAPPDDLSDPICPAFLFYTSGSTGKPKAIQLNQFGFLNHLALKTSELSLQRETVLQQSSFGFDMSLTQTFCALANGGSLVIVPKASRGDAVALSRLMLEHGVTFTIATPSEYAMLLRYGQSWLRSCTGWTHACMGGETVTQQLVRAFSELGNPNLRLTNCYGPTETSLAVSFDKFSASAAGEIAEHASVGKVLPNYSVYILDEASSGPVPLGYPGEICVGGAGVALGYLNLPDLSATKFVHDPFADTDEMARGWTRMFRTGDRGRLRADGSLIFMGRKGGDNMVKLRGLRIDLDDVANTLVRAASDMVAEAVVTVRGDDLAQMLVAHVVPRPGQGETLGAGELRELAHSLPLPVYMRPSLVVGVDSLPHTPNGKVDRRAVEAMELPALGQQRQGSGETLSLTEGELSLMWEEVLDRSMTVSRADLTPDDDFFMAGGSSLLLIQLQGAIRETLGVAVSVTELYQASTLGRMAAHLHAEKLQQRPTEDIDWERETEFRISSSSLHMTPSGSMRESSREILLTGAHTFLGAEILQALVGDGGVKRVHCVALPNTASKAVPRSSKTACYPGSLQAESLGLSPDDISLLQSHIDVIIHAGSVGHCLNNYSSLRVPNLGSLRFLVGLALPRRIPVHFVSSNRVTLLSGQYRLPPVSVGQHQPPKDGSEGYTASKWAGERLLEKAAQTTGLDVTLHRPCAVVGPNAPSEDALNALLRFAVLQSAVPRFRNFAGFLDFTPVAEVAANIARLALKKHHNGSSGGCVLNAARAGDAPVTIVHHSSGVETPVAEFRDHMEKLHGRNFGELDIADWIFEAVKGGMDPLISTYLEALVEKDQIIGFPYLGESPREDL